MICETCAALRTADGNPNLFPFYCTIQQRQIKNPYIRQSWCPLQNNTKRRTAKTKKQDFEIQTDFEEMRFIDKLPPEKIPGYIKGLKLRDQKLTDFHIPTILAYAEGRLK